jgi:hypothetical protein
VTASDPYLSTIRLSGQPVKRWMVMLGTRVQFEFVNSGVAHHGNQSLTRWGYRVTARPIYGLKDQVALPGEFRDREKAELEGYVQAMKLLTIALTHSANFMLARHPVAPEDDRLQTFLKLGLMGNGLYSQTPEEELSRHQEHWVQAGD